jgi:hypothetical protein
MPVVLVVDFVLDFDFPGVFEDEENSDKGLGSMGLETRFEVGGFGLHGMEIAFFPADLCEKPPLGWGLRSWFGWRR